VIRARIAGCVLAVVAAACGDEREREPRRDRPPVEEDDQLAELGRQQERLARERAEAEAALAAADGKHWYDLPKPGELHPGLHDCERYLAMMRSYADCAQLPASTRDAVRQSVDSIVSTWRAGQAMDPGAVTATNDGCKRGADMMIDTALMSGCTIEIPP
jgi:hypothetical protein